MITLSRTGNGDSYLSVDTDRLKGDVREAKADMDAIRESISRIFDEVNQLNGMWKGRANVAFTKTFKKDYARIKAIVKKINNDIDGIGRKNDELIRCENMVIDIASSLERIG